MAIGDAPYKGSDKYIWSGLSTDTKPTKAFVGQKIIETDSGLVFEWTGSEWITRLDGAEVDPLVKSLPVTTTFHHLGHEGKVFIHSDRHSAIAAAANDDILIRIPAGDATRQVHMRYAFTALANTGTLDIDVTLYEGVTVSADGTPEPVATTNDVLSKTSQVLIFRGPTVTDIGNFKLLTSILGANKGTSSRDANVPEWIMAPNGALSRDYLIRSTNNGAGTADIVPALFWYDTGAI